MTEDVIAPQDNPIVIPELAGLSPKQHQVILQLFAGKSIAEISRDLGPARQTLYNWLHDPVFSAAVEAIERQSLSALSRDLIGLGGDAIRVLKETLDDPTASQAARIRAANIVLDSLINMRTWVSIEQRIAKLENETGAESYTHWEIEQPDRLLDSPDDGQD